MFLWMFWGCGQKEETIVSAEDLCLPVETTETVTLYGHVGDLNTDQEGLPTGTEAVGVAGADVWSCVNDTHVTSDADGNFVLQVPDQEFVAFHVSKEGYIPARWIASPWVDGLQPILGETYANTILTPSFVTQIFGEVGIHWDEGKTLVVVDVVNPDHENPEGGWDLLGAVVELTSPIGASLVMDDDSRQLMEGNELSYHSDVIIVNVDPGPFEIVVTPPDDSVCHYPAYLNAQAGELLHVSIYCYYE